MLSEAGAPQKNARFGGHAGSTKSIGPQSGTSPALTASSSSRRTAALPVGMEVQTIELRNGRGTSLQEQVIRCGWSFEIRDLDEATARQRVIELVDSATLPTTRQHKGKERTDDLRPAIHHLEVLGTGPNGVLCAAELSAKPRVVRPSEVATVMAPTHEMGVAVRLTRLIEHDDSLRELIPSTDSSAPHARERAS